MSQYEVLADSLGLPKEKGGQADYRKGDKIEIKDPAVSAPLLEQGAIAAFGTHVEPAKEPEKKKSGGDK